MPYKFGEYVSTYVDPQSVKISETLRERFLSNFQANDKLTMAVEEMQAAAAFENDVNRKKELQRRTENALAQLAERGDFENLGFQVHKTAKQFAKDYAPIEENYRRYQGALQEVSKAYEKGDVNAEYAQLYKSYMTRGYKGFELDPETGRVKEGSMFAAPGIIKDPKVFDRIKKAIEIINPKEYSGKSSNIQQGPDGMYKITTESGVKEIPKEVVQGAIDMVMDEPDVKAYIGQMSDMQAYNLYAQGRLPEVMQGQAERISSNIDMLTKELESGKLNTATKKQYTNTLAKLRTELETINGASASDESAYSYVKQRLAGDMFRPVEEFVMEAVPYRNVTEARLLDYDAMWLQDRKAAIDAEAALGTSIHKLGEVTAKDIYGTTLDEKQSLISATYQEMVENEKIASNKSINDETREAARQRAASAKTRIGDIRKQIELATNKTMSIQELEKRDPKLIQAIREAFPWATTPGQVLLKMQDVFNNPTDSNSEYVKVNNAFKSKFNEGVNDYVKVKYAPQPVAAYESKIQSEFGQSRPESVAGTYANPFDAFTENFKEDINYNFSQVKESSLFNYGKIDVGNPKATVAFNKAVDGFFLNKPLAEDQVVLDVTKDGVQEISGKDLKGYTVVDRGWNQNNNLWELQLKNDKGEVKTVHYDGNNITSPAIQNILSQNDVKFSKIASSMNSRVPGEKGITTREIGLLDSTGTYTNTKIILSSEILSNGDQVFSVRGTDGKPLTDGQGNVFLDKKYRMTDKEFKDLIMARQLMPNDNPNNPTGPPIVELIY